MYRIRKDGIRSRRIYIRANGLRVPLLILQPKEKPVNAPGVLWIHGGGYMTGMKEMAYMGRAADLVREHSAVVVAPGYHLSLFHPYPTALNDCYAALLYIRDHAGESIRLQDLADQAALSMYYYSHLFKDRTGFSPMDYVANTRIEKAKRLLIETDLSVEDIAAESGYASSAGLIKEFKKNAGISPRRYRRMETGR